MSQDSFEFTVHKGEEADILFRTLDRTRGKYDAIILKIERMAVGEACSFDSTRSLHASITQTLKNLYSENVTAHFRQNHSGSDDGSTYILKHAPTAESNGEDA